MCVLILVIECLVSAIFTITPPILVENLYKNDTIMMVIFVI